MAISIIPEKEFLEHIELDHDVITAIERAYERLSSETVEMPPVMQINNHEVQGQTCVKGALVPSQPAFAAKVSSIFPRNRDQNLPANSGLMVVFDSRTGMVQAILLDNGYLTQVRTAAGGAVAAKHLARENVKTVGIIGAGKQARMQAEALTLVRDYKQALIWSRSKANSEALASHLTDKLGISAKASEQAEHVVRESDVVITATSAREPVVMADWLHPGLHITAMGSDAAHKNELQPQVLTKATSYVCDSRKQCEMLGELHHAIEAGLEREITSIHELGEVVAGHKKARRQDSDITVCDLTGVGVQDTAIALLALDKAKAAGAGIQVGGANAV